MGNGNPLGRAGQEPAGHFPLGDNLMVAGAAFRAVIGAQIDAFAVQPDKSRIGAGFLVLAAVGGGVKRGAGRNVTDIFIWLCLSISFPM